MDSDSVPSPDQPVKRSYRSPARDASAEVTRARIREAAAEQFVARGYVATSVRDIAAAAGVAVRTVHSAFAGGKVAVFREALGVAVVGDDDAVPLAERAQLEDLLVDPDPERVVTRFADLSADVLARAGPLLLVMIESAGADADLRAMERAGAEATAATVGRVVDRLEASGRLLVDVDEAVDVTTMLVAPWVHELLRRRGWSSARYRGWLTRTLESQLLGARQGGCHTRSASGEGAEPDMPP